MQTKVFARKYHIPFFVIPAHAGIQKNRLQVARLVHRFLNSIDYLYLILISLAQRHKVHKELNCRKFLCVLRAFVRNIIYVIEDMVYSIPAYAGMTVYYFPAKA